MISITFMRSCLFSSPCHDFKILLRIPLTDFAYLQKKMLLDIGTTNYLHFAFESQGEEEEKHVNVEEKKENSFVLYRVKAGSLLSTVIPLYYAMKRHLLVHTSGLIKFYDLILIFNNGI